MAGDPLFILLILACAAVLVVLATGLIGFAKGSEDPDRANRLMRWRIGTQAVAIVVFLLFLWAHSKGAA